MTEVYLRDPGRGCNAGANVPLVPKLCLGTHHPDAPRL